MNSTCLLVSEVPGRESPGKHLVEGKGKFDSAMWPWDKDGPKPQVSLMAFLKAGRVSVAEPASSVTRVLLLVQVGDRS